MAHPLTMFACAAFPGKVMVLESLLKAIRASEPTDKVVLVSNYTGTLTVRPWDTMMLLLSCLQHLSALQIFCCHNWAAAAAVQKPSSDWQHHDLNIMPWTVVCPHNGLHILSCHSSRCTRLGLSQGFAVCCSINVAVAQRVRHVGHGLKYRHHPQPSVYVSSSTHPCCCTLCRGS